MVEEWYKYIIVNKIPFKDKKCILGKYVQIRDNIDYISLPMKLRFVQMSLPLNYWFTEVFQCGFMILRYMIDIFL